MRNVTGALRSNFRLIVFGNKIFKNRKCFYDPQANGAVERQNRTMADMLSGFVNSTGSNWDNYLQLVAFAYNKAIHKSTLQSLFYILFCREHTLPSDLALNIQKEFSDQFRRARELDISIQDLVLVY